MSRNLNEDEIEVVKFLISEERLNTFRKITFSDVDAIELHQASMNLAGTLICILGTIEVALRNAVCHRIRNDYEIEDFLRNPPRSIHWQTLENSQIQTAIKYAQKAIYSKMENEDKTALHANIRNPGRIKKRADRAKARQETLSVSLGQVVTQLTIHFWKRLFSSHYEKTLWKTSLRKLFPNKNLSRSTVATELEVIYQIRNRLAHHEPIYGTRLEKTQQAIVFFTKNFLTKIEAKETAFSKLILPQYELLLAQVAIFEATFVRLTTPVEEREA
jgi:hypothetical protein